MPLHPLNQIQLVGHPKPQVHVQVDEDITPNTEELANRGYGRERVMQPGGQYDWRWVKQEETYYEALLELEWLVATFMQLERKYPPGSPVRLPKKVPPRQR
jgi:hypothetical protein